MAQLPLLTVGVWQKKSFEAFCQSKDRLISAINKGFNALAAVLSKDCDPEEVQCALAYLNVERSLALQFDKTKDDSLRDLVYGLLESLKVSLIEWTDERNQRRSASLPMDNNLLSTNLPPSFPIEPKEETIDDQSLPNDYQISASEFIRDEKMFKEEEMDNENIEETIHSRSIFQDSLDLNDQSLNLTRSAPLNSVVDPMDMSLILPRDNQDSSDSVKNEKGSISSRSIPYAESMENSDDDDGASMKRLLSEFSRKFNSKRKSYNGEEESEDMIKKRRVSKTNETELACPECEHRTRKVKAWVDHLRKEHSTTPTLAGLALLCECGKESLSDAHVRLTNHRNTTVIRKREGPIKRIDDSKATVKCILCEVYPTTACGYVFHLGRHHKSSLAKNGVYLKCSCGLKVRSASYGEHADECNPRQFTLHKLDDE